MLDAMKGRFTRFAAAIILAAIITVVGGIGCGSKATSEKNKAPDEDVPAEMKQTTEETPKDPDAE